MKAKAGIGRVLFCTLPRRRIMMLQAVVKKSAKTRPRDLKLARERMKEAQADDDA